MLQGHPAVHSLGVKSLCKKKITFPYQRKAVPVDYSMLGESSTCLGHNCNPDPDPLAYFRGHVTSPTPYASEEEQTGCFISRLSASVSPQESEEHPQMVPL